MKIKIYEFVLQTGSIRTHNGPGIVYKIRVHTNLEQTYVTAYVN